MLRVTVELVPFGDENMSETIGTLLIVNDGTRDGDVGNYRVRSYPGSVKGDGRGLWFDIRPQRKGVVRGHLRTDGAWPLVIRALRALRYDKDAR